jgi:hypothetical protein
VPGGTAGFRYFDRDGNEVGLPLTNTSIANSVTGIEVSITVNSIAPLKSGETYTTTATQRVSLRNLNFNR